MLSVKGKYRRDWYAKQKALCIEALGGCCISCGSEDNLQFDHVLPETKAWHITQILHFDTSILLEELSKCQLLCKKCHIEKSKTDVKPTLHGTVSMYSNKGCRCDPCGLANREYKRVYARQYRAMKKKLAVIH